MDQLSILFFFAYGMGQMLSMSVVFYWLYQRKQNETNALQDKYLAKLAEGLKMEQQTILHDAGIFPRWRKDENGVMTSLNQAYDVIYLRPNDKSRKDYIGLNDTEMWGKEIGQIFWENDRYVLETGNTLVKREKVSDKVYHVIIKSLTIGSDGKRYVDGWSFPDDIFNGIKENI